MGVTSKEYSVILALLGWKDCRSVGVWDPSEAFGGIFPMYIPPSNG